MGDETKPRTLYDERQRVDAAGDAINALQGDCPDCVVVAQFCEKHRAAWGTVSDFILVQGRRLTEARALVTEMEALLRELVNDEADEDSYALREDADKARALLSRIDAAKAGE